MAIICKFGVHWLASYSPMSTLTLQIPVLSLYIGERRSVQGNTSIDRMLVFSYTLLLESMYRHYPIFKNDEALAIAIAIYIAI